MFDGGPGNNEFVRLVFELVFGELLIVFVILVFVFKTTELIRRDDVLETVFVVALIAVFAAFIAAVAAANALAAAALASATAVENPENNPNPSFILPGFVKCTFIVKIMIEKIIKINNNFRLLFLIFNFNMY